MSDLDMTEHLAKLQAELWRHFFDATERTPRGPFFRIGDDKVHTLCIFAAVAQVVLPLVVEVGRLRAEVEQLQRESAERKGR